MKFGPYDVKITVWDVYNQTLWPINCYDPGLNSSNDARGLFVFASNSCRKRIRQLPVHPHGQQANRPPEGLRDCILGTEEGYRSGLAAELPRWELHDQVSSGNPERAGCP